MNRQDSLGASKEANALEIEGKRSTHMKNHIGVKAPEHQTHSGHQMCDQGIQSRGSSGYLGLKAQHHGDCIP